jgi:hypothetical protein
MIVNIRFSGLEGAKRKMQAPDVAWNSSLGVMDSPDFLIELSETGIEIELHEVEGTDEGLLVYKGQHVLLYIKDTRQDSHTLLYEPENSRRFHIADKCKTLESMRADNRYDRYVVTNRKDGLFLVDAEDGFRGHTEEIEAPLQVCRNCLKELDYKQYDRQPPSQKKQVWRSFSIEEFFAEFSTHFLAKPKYTDNSFPSGGYTSDWEAISTRTREAVHWICEECGVDLKCHKSLLHVHHKNGIKSDNSPNNLETLCAVCHGEEPAHGRMHVSQSGVQTINRLREMNS